MATRKLKHPSQVKRVPQPVPVAETPAAAAITEIEPGVEEFTGSLPEKLKKPLFPPDVVYRGGRQPGSRNKKPTKAMRILAQKDRQIGLGKRETTLGINRAAYASLRDISPLPTDINWERRTACRLDFGRFCKTYLPNTFALAWSKAHLACIAKIEQVFLNGGKFALAMPRGDGKTALARAAMIWGTGYAHRLFPFFIGSAQPKAQASLEYVKMAWYGSAELRQDFPEIAHAIHKLENRWHLARGQIFRGHSTYIDWGSDSVRYPILLLDESEAATYLEHDPGLLIYIPSTDDRAESWITRSAGITINTAGVDGSIRGEASVHPILLTQPRPDVVLIDDVQKDNKVDSTLSCDKLKLLIDGAIGLLSGPTEPIAALMPCTVMREGDVADTYVNPEIKPEWRGERHARVTSWPPGIDDEKISLDSPEGIAWTEYDRLRRISLRQFKDLHLATEHYASNRVLMDHNFEVSWPERFNKKEELSAQQACMNLRMEIGSVVFSAECQNKGRKPIGEGIVPITAEQLREKVTSLQRRICPIDTRSLVVHIDIQNEIFFWSAFACATDFTGVFVDYGTFPQAYLPYFRKQQTEEWSLLSRIFFEAYPQHRDKAGRTARGFTRAPLEAKIYHGLDACLRHILSLEFFRDDQWHTPIHIHRVGIDTRWGQATETVKRFVRDWSVKAGQPKVGPIPAPERRDPHVVHHPQAQSPANVSGYLSRDILVPYFGHGITALQKQYEEFTRVKNWVFEDQVNPVVKDVKWIWKPDATGLYHLSVDVNRMKTFLFQRLASPPGSPGSVSLFSGPPEVHELFAEHVCRSEYPKVVIVPSTSLRKEMWSVREGVAFDNDYLDCATACMALAGFNGAFLQHIPHESPSQSPKPRRLSEQWAQKRQEAGLPIL